MGRRSFKLSRRAGGAVAGIALAGAGFGVAVAGATGNSDQYTPAAKPYNGVHPNAITIGTNTYASTATLSTPSLTATTVTQPYAVTTPYATYQALYAAALAIAQAENTTIADQQAQITALLKGDLRTLLEPTGNYLKAATLAKTKKLSFAFVSPGVGTVKVLWKVTGTYKGKKKSYTLVSLTGGLKKVGDTTVKLGLTGNGRTFLKVAKKPYVNATVTYTVSTSKVSVSRAYKLVG